jgi:hypothetical protein
MAGQASGHLSWVWWHMPGFRKPCACLTNLTAPTPYWRSPLEKRRCAHSGEPLIADRDEAAGSSPAGPTVAMGFPECLRLDTGGCGRTPGITSRFSMAHGRTPRRARGHGRTETISCRMVPPPVGSQLCDRGGVPWMW